MNVLLICFLEDIVYKTRWNMFVGEVLMCEQETQIKATEFIQGPLLYP